MFIHVPVLTSEEYSYFFMLTLFYSQACLCCHLYLGITCFKQPAFLNPFDPKDTLLYVAQLCHFLFCFPSFKWGAFIFWKKVLASVIRLCLKEVSRPSYNKLFTLKMTYEYGGVPCLILRSQIYDTYTSIYCC